MTKKHIREWVNRYVEFILGILALASASAAVAMAADPVAVAIQLSDNAVAPDDAITVTPMAFDVDGNVIDDPRLQYRISIDAKGNTTGNDPVTEGLRIRFPKLLKRLINHNPRIDPNGDFADTDPNDPNYGQQTGGAYTVTATLIGTDLSDSADVLVLPSGTAKITLKTKQYGDRLAKSLGDIANALSGGDRSAFDQARRDLQAIATNLDFSHNVLSMNQVMAPPDGALIRPQDLTGFQPSRDDTPFGAGLDAVLTHVRNAASQINRINPARITQADLDAVRSLADRYRDLAQQLAALQPSALGVTEHGEKLDDLLSNELPKLFDVLKQKSIALAGVTPPPTGAAGPITWQYLFALLTDFQNRAMANVIELLVTYTESAINIMLAEVINRNAPPGMTIEFVQASAFQAVCPGYPDTFINGFGFCRNPGNCAPPRKFRVLLRGCVNSDLIATYLTLSPPSSVASAINFLNSLDSIATALAQNPFNTVAILTPDRLRRGLESIGETDMVFNNGWPQLNRGRLPCAGLIVAISADTGRYRATNMDFWPLAMCGR